MANLLDEVSKAGIDILEIAKQIAPNGKIVNNQWQACCPFHDDKNPSYFIELDRGLTHCFGCNHSGDIITDYAKLKGLTLIEAKNEILKLETKLNSKPIKKAINANQLNKAIAIWNRSIKDDPTLDKYLKARKIDTTILKKLDEIRIFRGFKNEIFPKTPHEPVTVMVSKITDISSKLVSLHLTFLQEEKGRVQHAEKMFFPGLEISGHAVHFGEPEDTFAIAEGIEDALSVKSALPYFSVWASLSASNMPNLIIPSTVKKVFIFIDNDDAGIKAGNQLASRLKNEGVETIIVSPEKYGAKDFNDVIKEHGKTGILSCLSDIKTPKYEEDVIANFKNQLTVLTKFSPKPIADFIKNNYELFYDKSKTLYLYDSKVGVWIRDADTIVKSILRNKILPDHLIRTWHISEILNEIKESIYVHDLFPEPPLELIPFVNCIYNLKTGACEPYSAEHYFTSKLAVSYNPEAKPTLIERTLIEIMDNPKPLYQLAGYTLYRDYPLQKFFILYGDGANGKTTYTRILTAMLGKQNVSNETLKDILTNRFSPAQLYKKLANISGDEGYMNIADSSKIKNLVGDDFVRAEQKNRDPFSFMNYAKIIINTNHIPSTNDKSEAFYRRVVLLEFKNKFIQNDDKLRLQKILKNPEEIEWFALQSIYALEGLIDKNFSNFIGLKRTEEIKEIYEKLSNPVETFIETFAYDCPDYTKKNEFSKIFNLWLQQNNLQKFTERRISKSLRQLGYRDNTTKDRYTGKTIRVWENLCLNYDLIKKVILGYDPFKVYDEKEKEDEPSDIIPF